MADTGNGIQVVVRLRPVNAKEKREGTPPVVSSNTKDSTVTLVRSAGKGSSSQTRTTFKADNVFGSFSTQEEVFDQTMPGILKDVLKGFESTVFAYGQTGTGKTHTMEGMIDSPEQRGIIPRAATSIFASLQDKAFIEKTVSVSYLEIYNQDLNDLLLPAGGATKSKLRIVEGAGNAGVYCQGLTSQPVETVDDVIRILNDAQERRSVGETKMNKASSRSHCIFTLRVESKEQTDGGFVMTRMGKLHMVDLAGSECAKSAGTEDAKQERERKNINTSLLALGKVVNALKTGNKPPYRDSLLTRLLQESLGGCCKTCIIATVSPSILCAEQSGQTLKYAQQAHGIQNKPVMTSRMGRAESNAAALSGGGGGGGGGNDAALIESFQRLELKCAYMEAEVEEAATALAAKHEKMREAVERAEMAEGKIDAIQTQLDEALLRAAAVERKHAEQLADMQQRVGSQSTLLAESTEALAKTQKALASHAALETREMESLKALASKSTTLVQDQIALVAAHRQQLTETFNAHSTGQLHDEHLTTLNEMEGKLEAGAAELGQQLEAQSQRLGESKATLQAGMQAENLVGALSTGQESLQEALKSQQMSLDALRTGLASATAKLQSENKAEAALATLHDATACVQGGVKESSEILSAQHILAEQQTTAMQTMKSSQQNMQEQLMTHVMEGVRALLAENLQQMTSGFESSLGTVCSTATAIDEERNKATARLSELGADFNTQAEKVVGEVKHWDSASCEVVEACDSVRQMSDTITASVEEAGRAAQERTDASIAQVDAWAASDTSVVAAVDAAIVDTHSARDSASSMHTAVGETIACAKTESKASAEHGRAISDKIAAAQSAAEACSTQLSAGAEAMSVGFGSAQTELEEQHSASEEFRGLAKEAEGRSDEVTKHLAEMKTDVSEQFEAANALLVSTGAEPVQASVTDTPAASSLLVEATAATTGPEAKTQPGTTSTSAVGSTENPFVPTKTKPKAKTAKTTKDSAGTAKNRRFGQKIDNIR